MGKAGQLGALARSSPLPARPMPTRTFTHTCTHACSAHSHAPLTPQPPFHPATPLTLTGSAELHLLQRSPAGGGGGRPLGALGLPRPVVHVCCRQEGAVLLSILQLGGGGRRASVAVRLCACVRVCVRTKSASAVHAQRLQCSRHVHSGWQQGGPLMGAERHKARLHLCVCAYSTSPWVHSTVQRSQGSTRGTMPLTSYSRWCSPVAGR